MLAVDTNILVRLITRDDEAQLQAAEAAVASGAWVSLLMLAETLWVLDSVVNLSREKLAQAVAMLLNHRELRIQDQDVVTAALADYRSSTAVGFSDCLVLHIARKAGHAPLASFDRGLAKLNGVQLLR